MEEWNPEPLVPALTAQEQLTLDNIPVIVGPSGPKVKLANTGKMAFNLAAYNFAGLCGNEHIKEKAIETLRKYGLGSCGPPGFYGTIGEFRSMSCSTQRFVYLRGFGWKTCI